MASQLPSFVLVYVQTPWRLVKVSFLLTALRLLIKDVVGTVVPRYCPGEPGTVHLLFQPWVIEPELTVENYN